MCYELYNRLSNITPTIVRNGDGIIPLHGEIKDVEGGGIIDLELEDFSRSLVDIDFCIFTVCKSSLQRIVHEARMPIVETCNDIYLLDGTSLSCFVEKESEMKPVIVVCYRHHFPILEFYAITPAILNGRTVASPIGIVDVSLGVQLLQ